MGDVKEIETTWKRIAAKGGFEGRMRNVRLGEWSLDWRGEGARHWHRTAEGNLDYLQGYVDGRMDGEGL